MTDLDEPGHPTDPWEGMDLSAAWAAAGPPDPFDQLDNTTPSSRDDGYGYAESFVPVDLAAALAGDLTIPEPAVLPRDDGRCLFYRGAYNGIYGDSGLGKSWIMFHASAVVLRTGGAVMILDYEDTHVTLITRLRALGVTDQQIAEQLIYIRPQDPAGPAAVAALCEIIEEHDIELVVVDSIGECYAVDGVNENNDDEVGPHARRFFRPLADAGAAVVSVDHATKANESPLFPSGSKRKRANITGAMYRIDANGEPLARVEDGHGEHSGRLKITCAKDRHGWWRIGEEVAKFELTSFPDEGVRAHLWPPLAGKAAKASASGTATNEEAVAVVCEILGRYDDGLGSADLVNRAIDETKISRAVLRAALAAAAEREVVHQYVPDGKPKNTKWCELTRPYTAPTDPTADER